VDNRTRWWASSLASFGRHPLLNRFGTLLRIARPVEWSRPKIFKVAPYRNLNVLFGRHQNHSGAGKGGHCHEQVEFDGGGGSLESSRQKVVGRGRLHWGPRSAGTVELLGTFRSQQDRLKPKVKIQVKVDALPENASMSASRQKLPQLRTHQPQERTLPAPRE
jgi:hypothetical protein